MGHRRNIKACYAMRIKLLTTVLLMISTLCANAQYSFTLGASWSGNCAGFTDQMNQAIRQFQSQAINGFPTLELCEQTRAMCHQELGHIQLQYIDLNTGRVIRTEDTNCKLNVTTTPCSGRPMAMGGSGENSATGVSQGTSFFTPNPANEIQNWSNDDMERMVALTNNFGYGYEPTQVSTGDLSHDATRSNYVLSGRMPEGSVSLIRGGEGISSLNELGHGYTDDLRSISIDPKPVDDDYSYSYETHEPSFMESIDAHLNLYHLENQDDESILKYIYTHWGYDNVMAVSDWWEQHHVGDYISGAITSVKNAIFNPMDTYENAREATLGKMKDNVSSAVLFLLPPEYQQTGELQKGVYDATIGKTLPNVISILDEAVEKAAKGETLEDGTLEKLGDPYMELAASVYSPSTGKAYKNLKAAHDISNDPTGKELAKWLGKKAKKEVESELDNRYGKRIKTAIDPSGIIFD